MKNREYKDQVTMHIVENYPDLFPLVYNLDAYHSIVDYYVDNFGYSAMSWVIAAVDNSLSNMRTWLQHADTQHNFNNGHLNISVHIIVTHNTKDDWKQKYTPVNDPSCKWRPKDDTA